MFRLLHRQSSSRVLFVSAASLPLAALALAAPLPAGAAAIDTSGLQTQPAPSFAPLIALVRPAVVSIKVTMVNAPADAGNGPDSGPGDDTGPIEAQGSGFFVSADGFIVTNNHVVQNATEVTVVRDDGSTLPAHVVASDAGTDLAVIKVNAAGDYPFVKFGLERPRVGDWVVAIGNPFGLGGSATAGIVSAEGRTLGDGPYDRFLQIDAPINRGNSGGPTFNVHGEVVGINTAIYSPSGGSVGIGFAIPASIAEGIVGTLERGGVVARGFLGVGIQPIDAAMADALGLKSSGGALVASVIPDSPAAKAGLEPGDVIEKLGGAPVKDPSDLTMRVGQEQPGAQVEITYLRAGAEKTATVTLAPQAAENGKEAPKGDAKKAPAEKPSNALGIEVAPASDVPGAGRQGVVILGVESGGAAASAGLTNGDIVLEVAGKPVNTAQEIRDGISEALKSGRRTILFRVHTPQGDRFVAVAIG